MDLTEPSQQCQSWACMSWSGQLWSVAFHHHLYTLATVSPWGVAGSLCNTGIFYAMLLNLILCVVLITLLNMTEIVKGIKWLEYRFQVDRNKKKSNPKPKLWCVYLGKSWEQGGCGISLCASTLQRSTNINQNHLAESVSQGQMLLLVLLSKGINGMCPEVR